VRSRFAAAAAAVAAAVAMTAAAPTASGAGRPVLTQSHQVTPTEPAVRAYGSPAVVVDPDDARRVFAAGVEFRTRRCVFQRSADGGRTWRQSDRSPSPPDLPFCTHNLGQVPVGFLSMGRDKTLYWAHVGTSVEDTPNLSVFVARSTDLGETWTSTVVRDARGKRGPESERNLLTDLAVDTRSGSEDVVYVSWMANSPRVTPPVRRAMVAVSADGGKTFGDPGDVSESFFGEAENLPTDVPPDRVRPANFGSTQPNLAVGGGGDVYVVWMEFAAGDPFHSPVRWRRMYVSRSSDRGRTFRDHGLVRAMTTEGVGLIGPMMEWSPGGGPQGTLHLVYESRTAPAQGDRDVQYQRSVDGGRTWSEVKVLNDDDPRELFGQFLPNVQVAPNGRVDVAWWDLRDGAARYATDVYYSHSEDAGESWSANMRVTDRSIDRTIGIWANNSDTRQPPGLGSADELAVAVWDDTRNGDRATDVQDLRAAAVQFDEVAERTSTAEAAVGYGSAALAGAGAVGLVLVIGTLVVRRRRTRSNAAGHEMAQPVAPGQR